MKLSFKDIAGQIVVPGHRPTGTRLAISDKPEPFVAPTFNRLDHGASLLAEVVLIRASAAVGKSTIAAALSSLCSLPVLNLALVPVGAGSLKGLVSDLRNGVSPIAAFHAGRLPVIIDALDEGRLRSGENGFESFLETSAEFLLEDRRSPTAPKLILFGRPEAIDLAELLLVQGGITGCILEVGFFGKDEAKSLIIAYADKSAPVDSMYIIHKEPAHKLIDLYFERMEAALGLAEGKLWEDARGQAFAGYAPVLATIGYLLPEIDNYAEALNRLGSSGADNAWGVIESVLSEIVARDRGKLLKQLDGQVARSLPGEAYDALEQFTLLVQHVQRTPLAGTGRVQLPHADMEKYNSYVDQWLPQHAFLSSGKFANSVLGSYVYANLICLGRPIGSPRGELGPLSWQPFLWRSMARNLTAATLIEGEYLGYILNSFWNDPLSIGSKILIGRAGDSTDVAMVTVTIPDRDSVVFLTTMPIVLFAQIKNIDVNIDADIIFEGAGDDGHSVFFSRDENAITARTLTFKARELKISGRLWLDAEMIPAAGQITLKIDADAHVGWGAKIFGVFPFSQYKSEVPNPRIQIEKSKLELLLDECAARFINNPTLTLNPDFSAPEDDPYTQWTVRNYAREFPILMRLLVGHGLASTSPMQASNERKMRVRLTMAWASLKDVLDDPASENSAFVEQILKEMDK